MEKKELIKNFKVLVEDLLDHYDEYAEEEKAQIKELFDKASELNAILDKYDIETKFSWADYFTAVGKYFEAAQ